MEAHEGICKLIGELTLDSLLVNVLRHCVVDVEQRYRGSCDTCTDVFGKSTVDIDLAGNGNAAGSQSAVYVARLKTELGRESGPALVGKGDIFPCTPVVLSPVKQGKLELSQTGKELRIGVSLDAELRGHVLNYVIDPRIALMLPVGNKKVELTVFLNLNSDVIKCLDRGIACEEVLRARSECDYLKSLKSYDRPGKRDEIKGHGRKLRSGTHGILGDVGLKLPESQVI